LVDENRPQTQVAGKTCCEDAISILLEAMNDDEPTYGTQFVVRQAKGLYNEGLYDPEESARFFRLATSRPDLLTDAEKRFWKLFALGYVGKSFTVGDFHEFWNHPSINTSHLIKDGE
jgi:hypothetical protein